MIVTIDGPAGAGKSTVARALAGRLGFRFLDTGAMYRAVALAAIQAQVDWDRVDQLADLAKRVTIEMQGPRVLLDGRDVSQDIRTTEVTAAIRHVANRAEIREHLVALQRRFAGQDDVVTEGRDQGTVAFPDAECKFFLTASAAERARRRVADLQARGEMVALEQVLAQQEQRDREDRARPVGALVKAEDAVEIVTDGLTQERVVDRLEEFVKQRITG